MSEERQSKLHKFHCPACAGKGILEGRSCPECDGVGVWAEYEGWIVYATLPKVVVTDLHYQLQHTFALCLRWLLLAGGILCLLVGLRNLLALDNQLTLSYDRFFALGIWSAAFFGLIWFWLT